MEKKYIVVSGASSGIGRALAVKLAGLGHHVLAVARRAHELESLALGFGVDGLAVDLSKESAVAVLKEKVKDWPKVDGVVNNAGQLINKDFRALTSQEFMEQYKANVLTAVHLIKGVDLKLGSNAHIVNISSMGGVQGSSKFKGLSAYSAAKGALNVLSECLAEEYAEKGVSVNALALGAVQTEMLSKAFPDYQAPLSSEDMAEFIADFTLNKGNYFNGKILQVALNNP